MAIKKGIVVLSGSTETHKFLDDGSGRIGREDAPTVRLDFSGSVFVEGLAQDLVEEVHGQRDAGLSMIASTQARMVTVSTQIATEWDDQDKDSGEKTTSLQTALDAEEAANAAERLSISTSLSDAEDSIATRVQTVSGTIDSHIALRESEYASLATRIAGLDQEIADMKVGSALFGANASYTENVAGMVQYILDTDGASDTAALAAVNAKEQAIQDESESREAADNQDDADIDAEATARAAAFASLSTRMLEARNTSDANDANRRADADTMKTNLESAAATADASLQTLLSSSVDGSGELSTRASADASLQESFDAADKAQTEAFTSLTARLSAQEIDRAAKVASLSTKVVTDTASNSTLQSTAESLIVVEEGAQETADASVTTSLVNRLASEKADHDAEDDLLSANISSEGSLRVSRDTSLSTQLAGEVASFDSSMLSLGTRLGAQTTDRNTAKSSISTRISADNSIIADMIGGVSFDGNLSALISFVDSVDAASDSAMLAAVQSLQSSVEEEATARGDGDASVAALLASEVTARTNAVAGEDSDFDSMEAGHLVRTGSMKSETDAMFSGLVTNDITPLLARASTTLATEAQARADADAALLTQLNAEVTARTNAVTALETARIGDASSGDTSIQNIIDGWATTLTVGTLTLTGDLATSDATVDGTVMVGRLDVATATSNGYLTASADHKGKLFYLDAAIVEDGGYSAPADFQAVFPDPQKWYFYEEDTWHPMPFYHDADGDGIRDQHDPNNSTDFSAMIAEAEVADGWLDGADDPNGPTPADQATRNAEAGARYAALNTVVQGYISEGIAMSVLEEQWAAAPAYGDGLFPRTLSAIFSGLGYWSSN